MKYFSPNYWFKLWVLSAPLFNSKNEGIDAISIDNQNIKDWVNKNTTDISLIENQELSLANNQTSLLNLPLWNNNLTTHNEHHKHRHEKSRNKHKRGINGGNEIEYGGGWTRKLYCSFKPEWWEEVVKLKLNNNKENFVIYFTNKCFNGVWMDHRIESSVTISSLGKTIYDNFWAIANKFIDSSRRERIRIVVLMKDTGWEIWNHDVGIRTNDSSYYSNKYLDNLQRDFPDYDKQEINLGIINDNSDTDIKNAIKEKYPNLDLSQISIKDKIEYSHFNKSLSAKISVIIPGYYSYGGNLIPTFSYVTQTKLNDISNYISNDSKVKQWIEHINDYNKNLPTKIEQLKSYTDSQKWIAKNTEKEIIKGYIRDWSYIHTLIEHELKIDELNKNVQGLKAEFDIMKNQINELEKRVTNLENKSNLNCANIAAITGGVSAIRKIGTIGAAIATITSGACAIFSV